MQIKAVWQSGSSNPDNANHFATIKQWWASLGGKEVIWQQRLIPQAGDVSGLNWDTQRFDEVFLLTSPEVRGITLYWQKPDGSSERNTTPRKLELDTILQKLYIFPQSQPEVVIRVGSPDVVYQTLEISNPQVQFGAAGATYVLSLKDTSQRLEVKVKLSQDALNQLKQQIP